MSEVVACFHNTAFRTRSGSRENVYKGNKRQTVHCVQAWNTIKWAFEADVLTSPTYLQGLV
jgi:hypothetical protein